MGKDKCTGSLNHREGGGVMINEVQAQVVRFITGPYGDNILVFAFPSAGVVLGVNGDPLNSSLSGIVGIIGFPR